MKFVSVWVEIGIPNCGEALFKELHQGFSLEAYDKVCSLMSIKPMQLADYLGVSRATLFRRRRTGHLSIEESDRLYRVLIALDDALKLFEGDIQGAVNWLAEPVRALGYKKPFEMLDSYAGTEAVRGVIGRLEHGVVT